MGNNLWDFNGSLCSSVCSHKNQSILPRCVNEKATFFWKVRRVSHAYVQRVRVFLPRLLPQPSHSNF